MGLFRFRIKKEGQEETAVAEIVPPGLPFESVVHTVRIAWGNALAPGVSQNRIECLGWELMDAPPAGWRPAVSGWSEPVVIWRLGTDFA